MKEIRTKTELIIALKAANQRVINWFTKIPPSDFFTRQGEVWSASNNMDHLIKSVKPLTKAFEVTENYFASDVRQTGEILTDL